MSEPALYALKGTLILAVVALLLVFCFFGLKRYYEHCGTVRVLSMTDSRGNTYTAVIQKTNWLGHRTEYWQTIDDEDKITVIIEAKKP